MKTNTTFSLEQLWSEAGFEPNDEQKEAILCVSGPLYLPAHIVDKALNGLIFNTDGKRFNGGRLEWGPYGLDGKGKRPWGGYK